MLQKRKSQTSQIFIHTILSAHQANVKEYFLQEHDLTEKVHSETVCIIYTENTILQ